MTHAKTVLAGLALLLVASSARAEYRTVLIQVKQDKEEVSVTIHSDVKAEQKSAASADEAIKVISEMKGWGSSVGVYITADRGVISRDVRNKLFAAVDDNAWLELEYFGHHVPKVVGDHFLKGETGK